MPKCPNCEYAWKTRARVCPNFIAQTSSKKIKTKLHQYKKNALGFLETMEPGKPFTTTDIIRYHGLGGHTEGDVYRIVCDGLVCQGILSKKRFSTKGHLYIKNANLATCEFAEEGSDKRGNPQTACTFDWSQAKEIEVEEVD